MKVLHVSAEHGHDYNENSIVLRVSLGRTTLLLMGDAESGPRVDPSAKVVTSRSIALSTTPTTCEPTFSKLGITGQRRAADRRSSKPRQCIRARKTTPMFIGIVFYSLYAGAQRGKI